MREGMTEGQVLEVLGKPDEVRIKGELGIVAEKYRWVYGIEKKGQFPRVGSVIFGANDTVHKIGCPARGIPFMLPKWVAPFSESAQKTPSGMYCKIDNVFRNPKLYDFPYIRVSLVNSGKSEFSYRHDHTGIRFSLILEVYDAEKTLLLREALYAYHSPHTPPGSQRPVLRVLPGSRVSEDVPIWWRGVSDGVLYPGVYYVRVAFPLERNTFYGSNLAKWELTGTLGEMR